MKRFSFLLIDLIGLILFVHFIYSLFYGDLSGSSESVAILGNVIRAISESSNKDRLERQKKRAGTIGDRIDKIKTYKPDLNVDRSGFSSYVDSLKNEVSLAESEVDRANYNLITSAGRPAGDELARDENRRTTANSVSRAVNTAGSSSDAISALIMADANERARNRQIDSTSLAMMENNRRIAEQNRSNAVGQRFQAGSNYSSGLFATSQANRDLDILEYQENELNPYLQAVQDARQMDAAINQTRGRIYESWAGVADDSVSLAMAAFGGGQMQQTGGASLPSYGGG